MNNKTRKVYMVKKKRKKIRKVLFFFSILSFFSVVFIGYLFYQTYNAANDSYNELDRGKKSNLREEEVFLSKQPVSILFMGVEDYSSNGNGGRADSIIVGTFNPKLKTMKLVSIPRDTKVFIEDENKEDKINHSYNYGKEATIEAVESLLDIPIDYYVTVNFDGFKSIIDEIGGIEVEVPFDFWEYTDSYPKKKIYFEKGIQTLDGEEALAFARMRKRDPRGDFGRNDRQKQIIKAVIDSLSKPTNILKIDDIVEHVGSNVKTNLRIKDGLAFQRKYRDFDSSSINTLTLKGEDSYINGVYYFVPEVESLNEVQTELKQHLSLIATNSSPNLNDSNEETE